MLIHSCLTRKKNESYLPDVKERVLLSIIQAIRLEQNIELSGMYINSIQQFQYGMSQIGLVKQTTFKTFVHNAFHIRYNNTHHEE